MTRKGRNRPMEDDSESEDFSDPEGFEDTISDSELLGDILQQRPKANDSNDSVVIIDGLPEVGEDRQDKLKKLIIKKQLMDNKLEVVENSYEFPINPSTKMTKGFAIIELKDKATAERAVKLLNNVPLDKKHVMSVFLLSAVNQHNNMPEKFEEPAPIPFQDLGKVGQFLLDENCFDQFSVIHNPRNTNNKGALTSIYNNSSPEPKMLHEKPCWTESMVRWSPRGTYLATFHQKGIALWGRETFDQLKKFSHAGVSFIDFSPNERFLVTYSNQYDPYSKDPKSIHVWDLRINLGVPRRSFHVEPRYMIWPVLKWSHDDRYFARCNKDESISVYDSNTFGMLDNKSIRHIGVQECAWSPSDNYMAYYIKENNDVPAKVSIMSLPDKKDIGSKNLFNVAKCEIYWQASGDYLCFKMTRYTKVKREKNENKYTGIYHSLEIFHIREKGIPVDSVEIKENIISFNFEPVDNKFGIICGEIPHFSVIFYQVNKGVAPQELKRYDKKSVNTMCWSPRGQFVVLAGMRDLQGNLEFIDTKDFTLMDATEHFMMTDVEWDPTGRFVATIVSWWSHRVDNAYWLHSFQGKLLRKQPLDELCQFQWRPRPPSLLSAQDLKEIKKRMKKYTATFELQDQMRSSKASQDILDQRRRLMEAFQAFRSSFKQVWEEENAIRAEMRPDQDHDDQMSEEVVEYLVKKEVVAA